MKIMLDANIIISAILFPKSIISEILKHIVQNNEIILSQYTIDEIKKVFHRKFQHKTKEMELFFKKLPFEVFFLEKINNKIYPNIRDIDDIPVLANAIESNADILITGDKDFDGIEVKNLKIIKPKIYYEQYIK